MLGDQRSAGASSKAKALRSAWLFQWEDVAAVDTALRTCNGFAPVTYFITLPWLRMRVG